MATEEKVTYCRVCEPLCGMVATVTDGELTKVRPDRDHPLSAGFACPKGIAMTEVQNDPDRVLHPLRRRPDGSSTGSPGPRRWTRSAPGSARSASATAAPRSAGTWAIRAPSRTRTRSGSRAFSTRSARRTPTPPRPRTSRIASPPARCSTARRSSSRSPTSPGPTSCSSSAPTRWSRTAACSAHRGSRTSCRRSSIAAGRVVVVDPRRSETARAFEHLAIDPDGDAWLLLSMLEVIFAEGLDDRDAIERQARGIAALATTGRRVPAGGDRGPQRRPRPRGAARSPATWRGPITPPSTGAPARAWAATGRWSRFCSTRSTSSPGTSTARAGRCSATRRSTSAGSPTSPASAPTAGCARGSATCPRCSARSRRR